MMMMLMIADGSDNADAEDFDAAADGIGADTKNVHFVSLPPR